MLDRPEVDALYDLDPSEFVAARDRVAKELKAAGDAEGAAAVKALKRPTKVAWAVNQIVRGRPDQVDELLAAGADLRERQADALSGGDAGALREATARRRDAVRVLVAAVVEVGGDGAREESAATFEAASVDQALGALLRAGRLSTALDRPTDMGFGGMPEPPARAVRPTRGTSRPEGARSRRPTEKDAAPAPPIRIDRKRLQKLERQLAAAERDATAAGDAVADAERRLARAEDAVTAAEAKRADAETALAEAHERERSAVAAVAAARDELGAASPPD